ncbi:unnamed protein product, partial [Thlaspi arvense]
MSVSEFSFIKSFGDDMCGTQFLLADRLMAKVVGYTDIREIVTALCYRPDTKGGDDLKIFLRRALRLVYEYMNGILRDRSKKVLEIGIRKGPNFKSGPSWLYHDATFAVDLNSLENLYRWKILKTIKLNLEFVRFCCVDGTFLRLVHNVLDPLQQVVDDGCHLTRHIGDYISEARFNSGADINKVSLSSLAYITSHVYCVACNKRKTWDDCTYSNII